MRKWRKMTIIAVFYIKSCMQMNEMMDLWSEYTDYPSDLWSDAAQTIPRFVESIVQMGN